MNIETAVIGLIVIFTILALFAFWNWYDLARDARSVRRDPAMRDFVHRELVRVRLRALGWTTFALAMTLRLALSDGPHRGLSLLAVATVAGGVMLTEATLGRAERWSMLGKREDAQELSDIGRKLDAAAREGEDRFSEGELEKREVRERVDAAAVVSKGELEEVKEELAAKIDEVIAMLEARDE